jgi:hypothetical protein
MFSIKTERKRSFEKIILNWRGFNWLRMGPVLDSCEYGNESSGSIKGEEFLEWPRKY